MTWHDCSLFWRWCHRKKDKNYSCIHSLGSFCFFRFIKISSPFIKINVLHETVIISIFVIHSSLQSVERWFCHLSAVTIIGVCAFLRTVRAPILHKNSFCTIQVWLWLTQFNGSVRLHQFEIFRVIFRHGTSPMGSEHATASETAVGVHFAARRSQTRCNQRRLQRTGLGCSLTDDAVTDAVAAAAAAAAAAARAIWHRLTWRATSPELRQKSGGRRSQMIGIAGRPPSTQRRPRAPVTTAKRDPSAALQRRLSIYFTRSQPS